MVVRGSDWGDSPSVRGTMGSLLYELNREDESVAEFKRAMGLLPLYAPLARALHEAKKVSNGTIALQPPARELWDEERGLAAQILHGLDSIYVKGRPHEEGRRWRRAFRRAIFSTRRFRHRPQPQVGRSDTPVKILG